MNKIKCQNVIEEKYYSELHVCTLTIAFNDISISIITLS